MRAVNLFCHYLCFCRCLTNTHSLYTLIARLPGKMLFCLSQLTSCEAVIAECDVNTVSSRSMFVIKQHAGNQSSRLSVKWTLNSFSLVKCSSLFFPVFLNLVVQVQDVFKDVCTCFLSCYLCCFVPSLCILLFKYKILFLDKERMDGNTTRGSLSISFIIFVLFRPNKQLSQS